MFMAKKEVIYSDRLGNESFPLLHSSKKSNNDTKRDELSKPLLD